MPEKITLVIGAGASKDLKPKEIGTGLELVEEIAHRVVDTNSTQPYLSAALTKQLGIDSHRREKFHKRLTEYMGCTSNPSIDEFLDQVENSSSIESSEQDMFMRIGRIMILAHICGYEGQIKNEENFEREPSWLNVLDDLVLTKKFLNNENVDLTIVTFNYDRIIEHFLLKKYSEANDIAYFINRNLYHVYGRVGNLPNLEPRLLSDNTHEETVDFGLDNDRLELISNIRNHIKLIYERDFDLSELRKTICSATKIFVLGYGFDDQNNERLGLSHLNNCQKFVANVYGSKQADINRVKSLVTYADVQDLSCQDFIKYCFNAT